MQPVLKNDYFFIHSDNQNNNNNNNKRYFNNTFYLHSAFLSRPTQSDSSKLHHTKKTNNRSKSERKDQSYVPLKQLKAYKLRGRKRERLTEQSATVDQLDVDLSEG